MVELLTSPLLGYGLLLLVVIGAIAYFFRKVKKTTQTEDRNATLENTTQKMEDQAVVDNRPRDDAGTVRDRMRSGGL